MLLRFAFENFRSVKEKQEISAVAAAIRGPTGAILRSDELGVGLLRVLAMYGANASGKTTLIRALAFMRNAVAVSHRSWPPKGGVPREPFLLDAESVSEPSSFDAEFLIENVRFNYGFKVDSTRVVSEWLYSYPNRKRQLWFERNLVAGEDFKFGKNLAGENRTIQNLTRENSLFLSSSAQNAHQQLLPVYEWFTSQLEVVALPLREHLWATTASMCADADFRESVLRLLSVADLGIVDVEVTQRELDEKVKKMLASLFRSLSETDHNLPDEGEIGSMPQVVLRHESSTPGESIGLRFEDESDGTKALFAIAAPVLRALARGGTLCIDELDASLHPLLASNLVKAFNADESNPNRAQLIFNTHDVNLLDGEVLRRDQVWFAEKDKRGATHFYSLADFKARRDENFGRGYLQGRYGAVPFIGSLSQNALSDG